MKKFNSFRNRQNGFEDLGSGTAEAAKSKKAGGRYQSPFL